MNTYCVQGSVLLYIYYFLWLFLQHQAHYYSYNSLKTLLKVPRPVQKIRQDWSSDPMIVSCCSLFDQGFHSGSNGKKKICLECRRLGFNPWVGKIPWSRKWQPTPVFLLGEFHAQRSLVGYSPWGCKELDTAKWLILKWKKEKQPQ